MSKIVRFFNIGSGVGEQRRHERGVEGFGLRSSVTVSCLSLPLLHKT